MNRRILVGSTVGLALLCLQGCGSGEKPSAQGAGEAPGVTKTQTAGVVSGEEIYRRTCIACHQASGEGISNTFPPLAKSDFLISRSEVISQVIEGKSGEMTVNGVKYNGIMPPQALNDDEIAAVLTYVYTSWGNAGSPVTAEEVKTIRAKKI